MKTVRLLAAGCGLVLVFGPVCAADPAPKSPARIVLEQRHIELAPDASRVDTARMEVQVLAPAAIQGLAQQPISYSDVMQEVTIDEAYTLKKDGTKLVVAPGAIITQQRPNTNGATMLTDQKQKVIIYPNVEVGDTLVSQRTIKSKPLFPGVFSAAIPFPQSFQIDSSETVFVTPKSLPLYIETKDLTVEKKAEGDKLVYTLRVKVDSPKPSPLAYVSALDRWPSFYVSTLKTWEDFAKLYGATVAPKLAVTPKLQSKADEITQGVSDRREQVKKIYDWVAAHIRYVALEFGEGGFVPHDPEEVLNNAYGDCKDHAILFATLLKAKGIAADLVTIHASDHYAMPNVPVIGSFNHMINYIPSLSLYADTTQRTMTLGYLPRGEYGKSVLHVGSGMRKVPLLAQKDSAFHYTEHLTLDAAGGVTATGELTATGIAAGLAQREGLHLHSVGVEKFASELLERRGFSEASGAYAIPSGETAVADYKLTSRYSAPKQQSWLNGAPFVFSKGLMFDSIIGEFWLGPIAADKYKKTELVPCYSGTGAEEYTLDLPAGKKLAVLPEDAKIEADGLAYASHWAQSGHTVTVKRTLALSFKDMLCRGAQTNAIHDALAKIKTDLGRTIALAAE